MMLDLIDILAFMESKQTWARSTEFLKMKNVTAEILRMSSQLDNESSLTFQIDNQKWHQQGLNFIYKLLDKCLLESQCWKGSFLLKSRQSIYRCIIWELRKKVLCFSYQLKVGENHKLKWQVSNIIYSLHYTQIYICIDRYRLDT